MVNLIRSLLANRPLVFAGFAGISAFSLLMAYIAQYGFGLEPCILCLYQRIPFYTVIGLALAGLWLYKRDKKAGLGDTVQVRAILGATTLTFFGNAALAFYHTGVERKWWPSHLEGCTVPMIEGNITDVLAQIEAAPVVRCDEIPWTDPIIGLSMANYNVMMCLGLAAIALLTLLMRRA